MKVLVLNCGSSSIKYQFFDTVEKIALAKGLVERIGMSDAILTHNRHDGESVRIVGEILDHTIAIEYVIGVLMSKNHGVIESKDDIDAIGHRVVHGGEDFSGSVLITDEVVRVLKANIELAPLHNPPNIKGIEAITRVMPEKRQVGVFDTSFHAHMPPKAYLYGIPYELYRRHKIRRYGFHGTSHRFVSQVAADMIGKNYQDLKIITAHLGNGCSMAAIDKGVSVDTTMGFTPLEGLLMGTRGGDMDPSIILHVMAKEGLTASEANAMLNKHSGLIGVSGVSSDMREIENSYTEGHKRATYAFEMFTYRIKKYVGAYAAAMGGLDILVFTGGIGENSPLVREAVCKELEFMGIKIDQQKNAEKKNDLSAPDSLVKVYRIPTNEELVIALDTEAIVSKMQA